MKETASPRSSASSASQSITRLPRYGAPAVPEPLDVSSIQQAPCEALTPEQLETFAGTVDNKRFGDSTRRGNGKNCDWIFQGDRYSLGAISGGVVLPEGKYMGLTTIYYAQQQGALDVFRPINSLAGYPAVVNGDEPHDGRCRLSVGLRDDTLYRITTGLLNDHPDYDQPCKAAKKLGEFVVTNLKEGN